MGSAPRSRAVKPVVSRRRSPSERRMFSKSTNSATPAAGDSTFLGRGIRTGRLVVDGIDVAEAIRGATLPTLLVVARFLALLELYRDGAVAFAENRFIRHDFRSHLSRRAIPPPLSRVKESRRIRVGRPCSIQTRSSR